MLAALAVLLGGSALLCADEFVISARGLIDAAGKIQDAALVLVRDGKIVRVGGDAPKGVRVAKFPGGVLSPGLIDVRSALGAFGQLSERADARQTDADARAALDRHQPRIAQALRAGVTAFAVLPSDDNLVGGRSAVVRASGADGLPQVLAAGPLALSLSPRVFMPDREPVSRVGALHMLRSLLRAAGDDEDALGQFAAGKLPGIITTPSAADVLAALSLASEFKLKLALIHNDDARKVAAQLAEAHAGVIVGPYDFDATVREATAAGVLERAGVAVAIAGGLPTAAADTLRIGAAVAVHNGMTPAAARRAITITPAKLLGVDSLLGSIQPKHSADLVVFSGDPLDLRSRVIAVFVAGRRINLESNR